ncbi:MAG: NINE protein [Bacteroidia bacterium]|nr:NINE protein [Bacteroidia bacterium]
MKFLVIFSFFFLIGFFCKAEGQISKAEIKASSLCFEKKISFSDFSGKKPNLVLFKIKKWLQHTKRVAAAVLAFPLPFGILALHRIYLGTKPYVPVVYIATVGGVFGILPFIDFCVLLLEKDAERFNNNHKVFMWIK